MVEGLDSLKRKLTLAIPYRVRQRTRAAMEKGAGEIVAMAKSLAPVLSEHDPRRKAGALRDSIGWTWGDAPKGSIVLAQSASVDGERITIYAGDSEAFYARWVEFGTQKMPAIPFFFPSYRTLRKRVKGRITREMKKAIREGAK
ncbi:HK97-gp10 family putative phage morphogenesis protein [Sinorhizobium sp. CCBAU 05631]|uniref:HK97-gp10 family putative phage morphogenesis protein n=1 Tax=Sinorhizobium sp. CCBAU 05631 TaxID=794846 RepID=UPI0004ADFCA7|nr:HK97-gp10 family putative phage morphogenesis protein [Sinorhizobium sp. CCBAU 05631]ASY56488.1 phage protein, HK97 GP10 family [Sinorhizobium sp. CCBAU 05631]